MANNYYSPTSIVAQTKARSSQENSDRTAVETAFDRLPTRASMDAGSVWFVEDTGAVDVYAVAMQKTATSYTDGMSFDMRVANTNTGACTVNVDGLGAKAIKLMNGTDPIAGDLTDGDIVHLVYDSDQGYFRITSVVQSIINGNASMSDTAIKTAYENNANTNAFTDAEKTKLASVETGATADQTGAEIKVAYEAEADTNAFTDAAQAKVAYLTVTGATNLDTMRTQLNVTAGTSEASKAVTADANGNVGLSEEVQAKCYIETVASTLSGTTPTVSCHTGNYFSLTTSGNTTFTFDYSGVQRTTNDVYAMIVEVTAGGTHTLTWPAAVEWPGGVTPDAPASGETDLYSFVTRDGGTTWRGTLTMNAVS